MTQSQETQLIHLSLIVGGRLFDHDGERLGRVRDLIVRLGSDDFPPVTGVMVEVAGRRSFLPIADVATIDHDGVRLQSTRLSVSRFERRDAEVLLRKDVLDRQLINLGGARLVRTNDIEIACVAGTYRVIGVDTTFAAIRRRLAPRHFARRIESSGFISWSEVEPFVGHVPSVRLRVPHPKLLRMHAADIADLVEAASHAEGEEIIAAVRHNQKLEADVFEELDLHHKLEFLEERDDASVGALLSEMESDDASRLLADLPDERRPSILQALSPDQRRKVEALFGYSPTTAGALMNPDVVSVTRDSTIEAALDAIAASEAPDELLTCAYIVDPAGTLLGAISVPHLLRCEGSLSVGEIVTDVAQSASQDSAIDQLARHMADFDLIALPVVDEHGKLLGAVTVDDVLQVILPTSWKRRFAMLAND